MGWFYCVKNKNENGNNALQGDLYDHGSLVKAIKHVDVVISTVGHLQLVDQVKIIAAIKEAGNVKVSVSKISFIHSCFFFFFSFPNLFVKFHFLIGSAKNRF